MYGNPYGNRPAFSLPSVGMAGKNANGEGSIYKRMKDGRVVRYEGQFTYTDLDGRTKRHTVYGRTRAEAVRKLKDARERVEVGAPAKDSKVCIGQWMAHWRATTLEASNRSLATKELYANLSRTHLEIQPFASTPLDRLKPSGIEQLVLALRAKEKTVKRGGKAVTVRALSDSTIRTIYTVLRAGLDGARRDGLIARNPAEAVERPGVQRTEARHLTADESKAVLEKAKESRYYLAILMAAKTGMRRGEVLALQWDNVDLEKGFVRVTLTLNRVRGSLVFSEPKTERSRRVVPLTDALVEALKDHRDAQRQERGHAGDQWVDCGRDLVFRTEAGSPVDPRNVLRVVEKAARDAGLSGVGVHTFRHSAVTMMLEEGVHIKAASDIVGHSSTAITADMYGHATDEAARSAIDAVERRLA